MSKVALADSMVEWDAILNGLTTVAELDRPDLRELHDELAAMVTAVRQLAAHASARAPLPEFGQPRPERRRRRPGRRHNEPRSRPLRAR